MTYYSSYKTWMASEITESVLTEIYRKMAAAKRNISLFMDNASWHPEKYFYTQVSR